MGEEQNSIGEDAPEVEHPDEVLSKRARSQIEFPYTDEERAVELATVLLREGGQAKIELTQLAAAMDQSVSGGTFRSRMGAARMFGLVDGDQGKVGLTPLGLRVTDDQSAAAARADAFLNVPLYREMYDRYQGYALPPAAAIERQMESLGVAPKQKERARQAFSASAQYAGYIAPTGRFIKPTTPGGAPVKDDMPPGTPEKTGGGDGGDGEDKPPKLHPFVEGLLKTLPPTGADWDAAGRVNWLVAAASIFTLIYKGDGSTVSIAVSPKKE